MDLFRQILLKTASPWVAGNSAVLFLCRKCVMNCDRHRTCLAHWQGWHSWGLMQLLTWWGRVRRQHRPGHRMWKAAPRERAGHHRSRCAPARKNIAGVMLCNCVSVLAIIDPGARPAEKDLAGVVPWSHSLSCQFLGCTYVSAGVVHANMQCATLDDLCNSGLHLG